MRLLVIERYSMLSDALKRWLAPEGHSVETVHELDAALQRAAALPRDVILVDIDTAAPAAAADFVATVRQLGIASPVLVVGGNDDDTVIQMVRAGADGYLYRPISGPVLLAHVRAVRRRTRASGEDEVSYGDVVLNRSLRGLTGPLGRAVLTAKEFAVLDLLFGTPEHIISRTELLARVWGFKFEPRTSVVEVAISRVRQKLASVSDRVKLQVRRNLGFSITMIGSDTNDPDVRKPA